MLKMKKQEQRGEQPAHGHPVQWVMNTGLSASRAQTPFPVPAAESGSGDDLGGGGIRSETRPQVPLSQPHNGSPKARSSASPHQAIRPQIGVHQGSQGNPSQPYKEGSWGTGHT